MAGWAGIAWPTEYGGRGLTLIEQLIWYEEYARARRCPAIDARSSGFDHAGPTLIAVRSDGAEGLPPAADPSGEVIWCQGFSEPGAGSDLASLSHPRRDRR